MLGDIRAQVAAGAQHITFGDPDFLNGPTHARRIVEALAREWPGLTFDVVIKIEHILRHRELMAVLRDSGCLFVTSAVESVDDRVLARLEKGHTRADFEARGGVAARDRAAAGADVRRLHAVDHHRRRTWRCSTRSSAWIWSTTLRPCSSRSGC